MAGGDLHPSRRGPWVEAAQRSDDEIPWPVAPRGCGNPTYYAGDFIGERSDGEERDWPGIVDEIEISESAAITVEQIDDEITVAIASVVCVHFQVTADQALKLSRALAVAADNAARYLAATET